MGGAAGFAVATDASSFPSSFLESSFFASSFLASMEDAGAGGFASGGLATGPVTGCAPASLCCVIARSTSPGREIWERSILVLISGSPCEVAWVRDALDPVSPRERRRLRTSSASCSSSELECVFFSVTPTSVRTSRISLLLTSSSRARSLIRIFIRSRYPFRPAQSNSTFAYPTSRNRLPIALATANFTSAT